MVGEFVHSFSPVRQDIWLLLGEDYVVLKREKAEKLIAELTDALKEVPRDRHLL